MKVEKEFKIDGDICTLVFDGDIQMYKSYSDTIAYVVKDDVVLYSIYTDGQVTDIVIDEE